jgi:CheY-like chemotaxis protein/DNA-binding XRE family transcriptional regulator
VAEDNQILRELHLKQLAQLGFAGESAANGLEVLECVSRRRYDLILMDISMPEMDGFAAARMIRMVENLTNSPHTPVVAVTGVSDVSACMKEGLDDYMAKPVMLEQLRTVLSRWVSLGSSVSDKDSSVLVAARTVIKARREALGLSQHEVASKAGLTESYIEYLETEAVDFGLDALSRIAKALNVRIADFVAWIELVARERDIFR